AIGFEEIELAETAEGLPADFGELRGLDRAADLVDREEPDLERCPVRITMDDAAELAADQGFDAELLAKLACERLLERFVTLELAARKFPSAGVRTTVGTATDQRRAAADADGGGDANHCRRAASRR